MAVNQFRVANTKVLLGGVDISDSVLAVNIERLPTREIDHADVTLAVCKWSYEEDTGTLVVHCIGPDRLTVRPEKRVVL